jgi:hypothetical protein
MMTKGEMENKPDGDVSNIASDGTSGAKVVTHFGDSHGLFEELKESVSIELIQIASLSSLLEIEFVDVFNPFPQHLGLVGYYRRKKIV